MYQLNDRVFLVGEKSGKEWRKSIKQLLDGSGISVADELDQSDPDMRDAYRRNEHFIHDRVLLMYSGNEECMRTYGEDSETLVNLPGLESECEMGWPVLVWNALYTPPKEAGQQFFLVVEKATDCPADYAERRSRFAQHYVDDGARVFETLEQAAEAIKALFAKPTAAS